MSQETTRAWALLVTDGTIVEFAPELYASRDTALREGRRWAWLLSAGSDVEIVEPFEGRIQVGIRDIRIVDVDRPERGTRGPWIGTFWTGDGYPDPEAIVLADRADAKEWVSSPLHGLSPASVSESQWHVAATFVVRGDEAHAVAHPAKVVCLSGL